MHRPVNTQERSGEQRTRLDTGGTGRSGGRVFRERRLDRRALFRRTSRAAAGGLACAERQVQPDVRRELTEPGSRDQARTPGCEPFSAAPSETLREREAPSESRKNSDRRSAADELSPLRRHHFEAKKRPEWRCREGRFALCFVTDTATYLFWDGANEEHP